LINTILHIYKYAQTWSLVRSIQTISYLQLFKSKKSWKIIGYRVLTSTGSVEARREGREYQQQSGLASATSTIIFISVVREEALAIAIVNKLEGRIGEWWWFGFGR
jgi:hypothetical protein